MPHYFFDILDQNGMHRDEHGLELADMDAAMAEARRALADMNRDAIALGEEHALEIVIRDHGEDPVRLSLAVTTTTLKLGEA